ncbi:MAG TPA: hypothetical protein VFB53_06980 [Burkholderiales bacterium]|nr:hypothetical protein [Burkholderiales bacterium]
MQKIVPGRRPFIVRALGALASLPLLQACMGGAGGQARSAPAAPGSFDFGVVGDIPYTRAQEAEYLRVMQDINSRDLEFVAHIGDTMFDPRPYERDPSLARTPLTDENYAYVLGTFQSCRHPLVLTPGDNDWSDAVQFQKVKVDPLERLAKLRATFYPKGRSLGQRTMAVESQAQDPVYATYVENLTWAVRGLRFATLHIVGSNDNARTSMDEHKARQAAVIAWMRKAFAAAKAGGSLGLVLITHANPDFENRWTRSYASRYARSVRGAEAPKAPEATPYDPFLDALIEQMQGYDKPVLYVHGDTHIFRIGNPLMNPKTQRFFENLTRLETFGWPDSAWVRVTANPSNPHLFEIHPEYVRGNSANYKA